MASDLLLQAQHAVGGTRLDLHGIRDAGVDAEHARLFGRRHGRDRADGEAARQPAGELGGAKDGAVARHVDEVAGGGATRWRTDASRIEVLCAVAAHHLAAFREERAAFVKERLEGAEVHFGGVGFHLPEVRVHGRVEREIGAQRRLGVQAHPAGKGAIEGIRRGRRGAPRGVAGHVGQELHGARG